MRSAGLLLVRAGADGGVELLLGHMGGPFWAGKDDGAWSIPKGEHGPGESPRAAAVREFTEELGTAPPAGELEELGTVSTRGKAITVFVLEADFDPRHITPGTFELEWPPRSGRIRSFPEIDRAAWFDAATARRKLVGSQVAFVDRLVAPRGGDTGGASTK